ncbi:hypothetical protein H920_20546 [Fukomys damarensis]|uniref:Uncharacterized protein n=1 Tax=Fukomys damarensis TaxID=885580 RepID=A0A091CI66_FUKDA|nr:hypothetical protein H920_20546 [Fukomys damarensis]
MTLSGDKEIKTAKPTFGALKMEWGGPVNRISDALTAEPLNWTEDRPTSGDLSVNNYKWNIASVLGTVLGTGDARGYNICERRPSVPFSVFIRVTGFGLELVPNLGCEGEFGADTRSKHHQACPEGLEDSAGGEAGPGRTGCTY